MIVVHRHTQKTVASIMQIVIIRMEYTTIFLAGDKGKSQGKDMRDMYKRTLLKPSCYLLFSHLVFRALVPKIGYDVRMLRWPSLVFCRFPFQEEKRKLS